MPPGRKIQPIPAFSTQRILQAEHCARLIWTGKSFVKNSLHTSDEQFLEQFSGPVSDFLAGTAQTISFDPDDVHDLVVVSGLKPLFRTWNLIDMRQFEVYLESTVPLLMGRVLTPLELGVFVKDAGRALVSSQYKGKSGYRVALASRLLFFALPGLRLFNFSNDFVPALNLQSRPQVAILTLHELMEQGLLLNDNHLKAIQLPKFSPALNSKNYKHRIVGGDWWQRRVLDLAIKLHFRTVVPLNPLPPRPV